MKAAAEKFSNQIMDLQVKVEKLTITKSSLRSRLSRTESELEEKDEKLNTLNSKQHEIDVTELRKQVTELISEKKDLTVKMQLCAQADESKKFMKTQTIELQAKVESEAKEKRSLQAKVRGIESEVRRKEKQIKDIVDRYSTEISTLENKLDDELRAKSLLQRRVTKMQNSEATSFSGHDSESSDIMNRIVSLEKAADLERSKASEAEMANKKFEQLLEDQTKANLLIKKELERLKTDASRSLDFSF